MLNLILGGEKGAGQVDVEGLAPADDADIGHRRHLADGTGIVEGDIETTEAVARRFDQRLGHGFILHITGDGYHFAAHFPDLGDGIVEFRLAARAEDELGALGGKELRRSAADTGTGAGDDGNLVKESSHESSF